MSDNKGSNRENTKASDCVRECARVITKASSLTEQSTVTPTVISTGPVFVKLPVVLAETNITIPVEAIIKLDENVTEIKRIRKNVFLTQSRLIPFSEDAQPFTAILFIEGFIRKNIEYATQTCLTSTAIGTNSCGDIKHCTVEVPFSYTTRISFLDSARLPIFTENTAPSETRFFTDELKSCDVCSDSVIGNNPCDQSFAFTEFFNEKPFVELVRADITEIDINKKPSVSGHNPTEQIFTKITEKIIVNLTLKVLQKQQVNIQSLG